MQSSLINSESRTSRLRMQRTAGHWQAYTQTELKYPELQLSHYQLAYIFV